MSADIPLNQLQPNMNSISVTAIVLDPGVNRRTQSGSIITMKVADSTGSINASIINPECDTYKPGDILKFRGAYTSIYQVCPTTVISQLFKHSGRVNIRCCEEWRMQKNWRVCHGFFRNTGYQPNASPSRNIR
ncbi:hypothetical protein CAEBREN_15185 [Caenorhabditis brenneri]|uniref:Uncharacterized protein n=1 Tax=Caenorhabditis brenneri TaxID=135651 RepID=G0MRF5_CAEBE|nr:hypothetical protein CAEBREN_15185 [Caenorhabditis brenneri]